MLIYSTLYDKIQIDVLVISKFFRRLCKMQNNGKTLSIVSLILGIASIVLAWFYMINIAALVCGIVGIILAAKGKKRIAGFR